MKTANKIDTIIIGTNIPITMVMSSECSSYINKVVVSDFVDNKVRTVVVGSCVASVINVTEETVVELGADDIEERDVVPVTFLTIASVTFVIVNWVVLTVASVETVDVHVDSVGLVCNIVLVVLSVSRLVENVELNTRVLVEIVTLPSISMY